MSKSLLYRLFRTGEIPPPFRTQLEAEGIVLSDEGIKAAVTYTNFHRPGKAAALERRWFTASITLSKERLLALNPSYPIINVPLTDKRLHSMRFTLRPPETLVVGLAANLFQPDWSGQVEYRFETPLAKRFLESLAAGG